MRKIVSTVLLISLISNIFGYACITDVTKTADIPTFMIANEAIDFENSENIDDSTVCYVDATSEGISLHQTLNKTTYGIDELISIQLELKGSIEDVNTTYVADGFSVVGDITNSINADSECRVFNVLLSHNNTTITPFFSFEVTTADGRTVCTNLYGYFSDHGLFISKNSFDAAKESSYYYLVECGLLTLSEFYEIMQDEYSKLGSEVIYTTSNTEMVDISSPTASPLTMEPSTLYITVTGTLGWIDDDNVWHPMQHNQVEVWDATRNQKLGTTYTNLSGVYTFFCDDTYPYRDICIKVYAGGENSIVQTENGVNYVYTSSTQRKVFIGTTATISWDIDMSSDLGKAFQISQVINVATQYVRAMNGTFLSPVTVKHPHTVEDKECFYNKPTNTIYICGEIATTLKPHDPYASWDVIMHEYGHHVQDELGIDDNPALEHFLDQNLAVPHGKDAGTRLAWGESYASVFGGMAQAYYASSLQNIDTVGDAAYEAYDTNWLNYEATKVRSGEACEASIIGVLWDLYDNTTLENHDTISFSHQDYWDMISNSEATTMSEFCNYFVARYPMSYSLKLGELLSYYGMAASDLTVSMNGTLPSFSWTANGTTSTLQNNRFDLVIFDENNNEILRKVLTSTSSYTLSDAERNIVFDSDGTSFYAITIAYQLSTPSTGGYYSEAVSFTRPDGYQHQHVYDNCVYLNPLSHRSVCACGATGGIGAHYVNPEDAVGVTFAPCAGCGYLVDLLDDGAGGIMSTTQVSVNGSYILPNGIVVLVDEDVEAYLAGTLQFYHPDDLPVTE